jgi:hypothetical protein
MYHFEELAIETGENAPIRGLGALAAVSAGALRVIDGVEAAFRHAFRGCNEHRAGDGARHLGTL